MGILDVEVLLSNFEGRDRVSVREFLSLAGMVVEEDGYREGFADGKDSKYGPLDADEGWRKRTQGATPNE